jgi:hypothetical protein
MLSSDPFSSSFSATLDCAGGIISAGYARMNLLSKCGEPDSKEAYANLSSERIDQRVLHYLLIMSED